MSRPNLFRLKSWERHETRVLEVFEAALRRLKMDDELPEQEDDLNRRLLFHARAENYRLCRQKRGTLSSIFYEANNQPAMDDIARSARDDKTPDFTCGLVDPQAGVDLFLQIECKRLGKPSSPSWVLNRNYISNGVQRFIESQHAYGKDASSGAMIGYLQTMDAASVVDEVNESGRASQIPPLRRSTSRKNSGLSRFEHELVRGFQGTPFRLKHFWIDLQHKYPSSATKARAAQVA